MAAALVLVAGAPAAADDPPSVAFVGDSIGRDAEPEIRANVEPTNPVAYYHAIGAGYTGYHLPLLLPIVQAPTGPDIVVAELGTGDAFWSTSPRRFEIGMRDFLDAVLPHVECVVWIDQKQSRNRAYPMINARAARFNDIVHRVTAEYEGVHALHYQAWTELAGSPSPFFLADYLHLTQAGERELGRLVGSAVRGCDPDRVSGPFWDVQDTFWAADAVNWAAAEGLVSGYANGTYRAVVGQFRPPVTRGQAAQMIWRLSGSPPEPEPHGWTDGRPWLRGALRWGRASGVLSGFADQTFRPAAPVTRGQFLNWLWRAVGEPDGYPLNPFADSTPKLRRALDWAVAEEVASGFGDEFRRERGLNRAEVAVWLRAAHAFLHAPAPAAGTAPTTTVPPATTTVPPAAPPTTVPTTTVPTTTAPTNPVPTTTVP